MRHILPAHPGKKRALLISLGMITFAFLLVFFSRNSNLTTSQGLDADNPYIDSPENVGMDASQHFETAKVLPEALSLTDDSVLAHSEPSMPIRAIDDAPLLGVVPRKIQHGMISLRVENVDGFIVDLSRIAESTGGEIAHSRTTTFDTERHATLSLRIPTEKLDRAIAQIRSLAITIDSEEVSTQDVTREFVDLEARIGNKVAQEERVRAFFQEAQDVEDLIEVEAALSRVRGQIESLQGQLNYLESQTSFSTVTLSVRESVRSTGNTHWNPHLVIKDSFVQLIVRTQDLIDHILRMSISSLPLIVFFLVAAWLGYRFVMYCFSFFAGRK